MSSDMSVRRYSDVDTKRFSNEVELSIQEPIVVPEMPQREDLSVENYEEAEKQYKTAYSNQEPRVGDLEKIFPLLNQRVLQVLQAGQQVDEQEKEQCTNLKDQVANCKLAFDRMCREIPAYKKREDAVTLSALIGRITTLSKQVEKLEKTIEGGPEALKAAAAEEAAQAARRKKQARICSAVVLVVFAVAITAFSYCHYSSNC